MPGRGENGKTWIFLKPIWRQRLSVDLKSVSVSPGKPTIISVPNWSLELEALSFENTLMIF